MKYFALKSAVDNISWNRILIMMWFQFLLSEIHVRCWHGMARTGGIQKYILLESLDWFRNSEEYLG
jgi:hypothetical protein